MNEDGQAPQAPKPKKKKLQLKEGGRPLGMQLATRYNFGRAGAPSYGAGPGTEAHHSVWRGLATSTASGGP